MEESMKTIEVSDTDYQTLEWLGSDKWMSIKGEPPLPVEKVLHRIIETEYDRANPPRYRSIQERGD
jgi:hypothetical protein